MPLRIGPFFVGGPPPPADVAATADAARSRPFNSPLAGATASGAPLEAAAAAAPGGRARWAVRARARVGAGRADFRAAVAAVRGWRHFDLRWARAAAAPQPPATGAPVVVAARSLGLWSLNPLRVTAARGGGGWPARRYELGHATVEGHQIAGEERFSVELGRDGAVWYEVASVSAPATPLAAAAAPVLRHLQRAFARDSAAAVRAAVAAARGGGGSKGGKAS